MYPIHIEHITVFLVPYQTFLSLLWKKAYERRNGMFNFSQRMKIELLVKSYSKAFKI